MMAGRLKNLMNIVHADVWEEKLAAAAKAFLYKLTKQGGGNHSTLKESQDLLARSRTSVKVSVVAGHRRIQ